MINSSSNWALGSGNRANHTKAEKVLKSEKKKHKGRKQRVIRVDSKTVKIEYYD